MKDFTKGVLFVIGVAGIYKLGVLIGRKRSTEIVIEVDDELKEILDQLKTKIKKGES